MKTQSINSNNPLYNIELRLKKDKIEYNSVSDSHIFRWDQNTYYLEKNEVTKNITSNKIELLVVVDNPGGGTFLYSKFKEQQITIPITQLRGKTTVRLVGIANEDLSIQTRFPGIANLFSKGEIVIESEKDSNWSHIITSQNTSGENAIFQIEYVDGMDKDKYEIDYDSTHSLLIKVGDEGFQANFRRLEEEFQPKGHSSQKESLGFMYSVYFPMVSEVLLNIASNHDRYNNYNTEWLPILTDIGLINEDIVHYIAQGDSDLALKQINNQICSYFYGHDKRDHVLNHFKSFDKR